MKQLIMIFILCIFTFSYSAQTRTADSLRSEGKLDKAILEYKKAFLKDQENKENTYNLACSLALTYQQNDSAFYYLNIALQTDSTLWALSDPDLIGLIKDNRWNTIVTQQMRKYQSKNGNLEYAEKLLQLIMKDQALDYQIDLAKKHYMENGEIPHWYYPLSEMKQEIVENNFNDMQKMLENYGWPKYSTVGKLAADAPLLIINHHPDDEVRKKYINIIKDNCLSGEGSCMEYAKIQDRILVNDGKLQKYGMQFRYTEDQKLEPFPVEDPEYVDQRRLEIGLEPLKEYLKRKINYDWNVPQKSK